MLLSKKIHFSSEEPVRVQLKSSPPSLAHPQQHLKEGGNMFTELKTNTLSHYF